MQFCSSFYFLMWVSSHISHYNRHVAWVWGVGCSTLTPLHFLRASAMLKHVIDIGWTSVYPSVRPSVTRWHGIKTAERIVMISSPHDSPFILVLCILRSSRNSDGVTPCGGAKYRWGIKFARFSTNKSLYLANDTVYRHGCYEWMNEWMNEWCFY